MWVLSTRRFERLDCSKRDELTFFPPLLPSVSSQIRRLFLAFDPARGSLDDALEYKCERQASSALCFQSPRREGSLGFDRVSTQKGNRTKAHRGVLSFFTSIADTESWKSSKKVELLQGQAPDLEFSRLFFSSDPFFFSHRQKDRSGYHNSADPDLSSKKRGTTLHRVIGLRRASSILGKFQFLPPLPVTAVNPSLPLSPLSTTSTYARFTSLRQTERCHPSTHRFSFQTSIWSLERTRARNDLLLFWFSS